MGTSKSGRYLNTKGSKTSPSHFAIVHSNEGRYDHDKVTKELRLVSGGHGQIGMNELEKYGIKYNIVETLPNGVRLGNIPRHMRRNERKGTHHAWFPKTWTDKDIKHAGQHITSLKLNKNKLTGTIWGVWKGVLVGVNREKGVIQSIYPAYKQPVKRRKN